MMADKSWKRAERRLADIFGSKRSGPLGREAADFETDLIAVEVKERKGLPKWLVDAMLQAAVNRKNKMPVVILHAMGNRYTDDIVMLRVGDMVELLSLISKGGDE